MDNSPRDTIPDPIPLGQTLEGKYRVRRVLGRGSMGVVYLGSDLALEREVAIKVLSPRYAANKRLAARFRREAVAMASVSNENVVQIFAFGDHEGCPYFIMEHVPGFTVANLIANANERSERLYLDVVLGILHQVAHGLQAVHEQGIVHRDVKPANMLVGPRFRVAIADFGLVETIDQPGMAQSLAGTPLYLAPELISQKALPEKLRHSSDIYALGISTYEMLTGNVPFDGPTVNEILRRHVEEKPKPITALRSDMPSAIDDVIGHALSKDPAKRFSTCKEFMSALQEARSSVSTHAPRTSDVRILVVTAVPEKITAYRAALKVGFPHAAVLTATDGTTAMEIAKSSRPNMILVDLELPKINGFELSEALRNEKLTAQIPMVVVASTLNSETKALLKQLEIETILREPVDLSHLVNLSRQYLEG
ncbi:MAG: serine/threonine-protein kinase [Pseudomonadota bacterium]